MYMHMAPFIANNQSGGSRLYCIYVFRVMGTKWLPYKSLKTLQHLGKLPYLYNGSPPPPSPSPPLLSPLPPTPPLLWNIVNKLMPTTKQELYALYYLVLLDLIYCLSHVIVIAQCYCGSCAQYLMHSYCGNDLLWTLLLRLGFPGKVLVWKHCLPWVLFITFQVFCFCSIAPFTGVATSLLVKGGQCQAVGGGVACIVLQIIYSSRQSSTYNLQINKL